MKQQLLMKVQQWVGHTETGNRHFHAGSLPESIPYYRQSLLLAEALLQHAAVCIAHHIPVIPLFIISCNNLAIVYLEQQQYEESDHYYLKALQQVRQLAEDTGGGDAVCREAARELQKTAISYLDFCKNTGRQSKVPLPFSAWGIDSGGNFQTLT